MICPTHWPTPPWRKTAVRTPQKTRRTADAVDLGRAAHISGMKTKRKSGKAYLATLVIPAVAPFGCVSPGPAPTRVPPTVSAPALSTPTAHGQGVTPSSVSNHPVEEGSGHRLSAGSLSPLSVGCVAR